MATKIEYGGTLVCSISVSDLDRSMAWYHDAMGFGPGGGATPAFRVADVAAARKHLESLGTRFEGDVVVMPGENGIKLANFFGPDGNPLTLAQPDRAG